MHQNYEIRSVLQPSPLSLQQLLRIQSDQDFNEAALTLFHYQAKQVPIYRDFLKISGCDPISVQHYHGIPFLPIQFFKSHSVLVEECEAEITFTSSTTTGQIPSRHSVPDLQLYKTLSIQTFEQNFGSLSNYKLLALLPSYLERSGSSLIWMVEQFLPFCREGSGFFLHDFQALHEEIKKDSGPVLLLGVTFALLDFAQEYPLSHPNLTVMDTGGMKGRRKERVREEIHSILKSSFHIDQIASEYGMTELLSQAYSNGEGLFKTPAWMRVRIRDPYDPKAYLPEKQNGMLCIIDLANQYSCAFIETADLGSQLNESTFTVLGRLDNSEIRGCNLMWT